MRTIARFMDARNTAEGKFLSVLLSVLLVFSFLNVTMFTDYANATDETAPEVAVEENQGLDVVDPVTDEPEKEADEPEAAPEQEQPESEEPVGEVTENEKEPDGIEVSDVTVTSKLDGKEELRSDQVGKTSEPVATTSTTTDFLAEGLLSLSNNVAPYAVTSTNISVGERISLSGNSGWGHTWSSSKESVAKVSGNEDSAVVEGLKAGTTTITHSYWSSGKKSETFQITVNGSSVPIGMTRVYVYFKLDSNLGATGWTQNDKGWYTVGYIDVPESVLM